MVGIAAARRFFAIPDQPELVLAKARALGQQIPTMYTILLINSLVLAATHQEAPALLRLYIPAALTLACAIRIFLWWRSRHRQLNYQQARRMLVSTVRVAALLGVGFATWALSLYPYGDAYQQSHVAFYMGITSIFCVFSLTHLRAAATMVAVAVLVPFTWFFLSTGNPVFAALAFNLVVVVAMLMSILLGNFRTFAALVASRAEMEKKQAETQRLSDENHRLANIDSLTGLPNLRAFQNRLEAALAQTHAEGTEVAVARLDLDSFKSVNDIFGRVTGDCVLVEVARRMEALRGLRDTQIARLGGDNFVLIMQGKVDEATLEACGVALTAAMREAFDIDGTIIHLSASAGLAASRPGDTPDRLYDRADYAASVAKRDRRGHAVVFSKQHALDIRKVRHMEHALLTADLDAEIHILFQPQFDVTLNRVTGYEVLARWRSPVLGEVSPGDFVPLAERVGMISKITQTVLRKALAASASLPEPMRLSVNLSAHDLASTTAIEAIVALIERAGKPCRVDFEITETAVMRDFAQANDGLLALLALGSRIALDDFGTGHSSLIHVQKLPLDRIKVDRSFVAEVTSDPTSRAIVRTTVELCRNLGISCVFEGIETEEQLDVVLSLGGTVMQGYLFGRPMEMALLPDHMAEQQRRIA